MNLTQNLEPEKIQYFVEYGIIEACAKKIQTENVIAAKKAGAARVWVCDQDQTALLAAKANAEANGVELHYCPQLEQAPDADIITVADVFYDRDNLPLLAYMQSHFNQVLMADCRLKGEPLNGLTIVDNLRSHTVPDLSESDEFNNVYIYRTPTE